MLMIEQLPYNNKVLWKDFQANILKTKALLCQLFIPTYYLCLIFLLYHSIQLKHGFMMSRSSFIFYAWMTFWEYIERPKAYHAMFNKTFFCVIKHGNPTMILFRSFGKALRFKFLQGLFLCYKSFHEAYISK